MSLGEPPYNASLAAPAIRPIGLLLTLGVVFCAVYLPWLGYLDLLLEEPRRALIARTMMENGDYLVPRLGGEIYTAKPPLFNWLIALAATSGLGLDEFSARLPSALSALFLALFMVLSARRYLQSSGLWFLGLAILLTPEFIAKGRLAEIEMVFTLLVTASVWLWFIGYQRSLKGYRLWVVPLILVALAYLAKREPAVVFFYLSIVPYLVWKRRWRVLVQPGHGVGIALAGAIAGGWITLVGLQVGFDVLWQTLQSEVLQRGMGQGWSAYLTHFALYPVELIAAMLPFSLLLFPLMSRDIRSGLLSRHGELVPFLVFAVLANLPIYWFRGDVSVRYFMPMFPLVLLLAALVFDQIAQGEERYGRRLKRYLNGLIYGFFGLATVLIIGLAVTAVLPWFHGFRFTLIPEWVVGLLIIGAGVTLWFARSRQRSQPAIGLLAAAVLVVLLAQSVYYNLVLPDKARRVEEQRNAPAIVKSISETVNTTVLVVDTVPWAVWYYAPTDLLAPWTKDVPLASGSYLLVDEPHVDQFASQGVVWQELSRYTYKGTAMLLVSISPGQ